MDVESIIKRMLILTSIKNGTIDFDFKDKSTFQKFFEENNEISISLFDYIVYKIVHYKLKKKKSINENVIIISEDYLKAHEQIFKLDETNSFKDKIFLIPCLFESNNKWGLMILFNLYKENEEITVKIISTKENKNIINKEYMTNDIIKKINPDIKINLIKYKIDLYSFNEEYNSNKFLFNFINEIIEKDNKEIEEYITNLFDKNLKGETRNNIMYYLSTSNDLFSNIFEEYNSEIKEMNKEKNSFIDKFAKKIVDNIMNIEIEKKDKSSTENNINSRANDDIFDLNFKEGNNKENCNNRKIDDVTKNTIDDILDSVLKDMKLDKNNYKKKIKKKNKIKFLRRNTFNIQQRIDVIEEEDKESSTSEIPKEKIIDNNIKSEKEIKDEKIIVNNINNSFEIEKRASNFSYNKENYDDSKLKEGEIDFEEDNNIIIDENNEIINNPFEETNIKCDINDIKEEDNIDKDKDCKNAKNEMNKKGTDNNNIKNKLYKGNVFDIIGINNNKDNNKTDNDLMVETNIKNNENNEVYLSKKSNKANENCNININKLNKAVSFNEICNNINILDKRDSPKDNNRNRVKDVIKNIKIQKYKKSNIEPSAAVQNVINKNSINNISINSINAKNIIIINNTIFTRDNKLPKEKKKEIIRKEKVPEDEKVPKDNYKKKSSLFINISQIAEKFPLDNAKMCSPEHKKSLMKETFQNDETKYCSKTIKIDKCRKNIFYRNYSNVENRLNKNININNISNYNLKTEKNYNKIKKINEKSNSFYGKNKKKSFINKYNNINPNMTDKFVTYAYRSQHNLIDNFDNKNIFVNKNNNKSRIDLNKKAFHLIKSRSTYQNEKYPKIMKQNKQKSIINNKKNFDDDSCILF